MIEYILLDMDGVIVDWVGGVCRLFNRDPEEVKAAWPEGTRAIEPVLNATRDEIWRRIDATRGQFWRDLQMEPWADELWYELNQIAPTIICSSPGLHPSCFSGKIEWLRSWRSNQFRQVMLSPHKHLAARPEHILIDDWEVMTDRFKAHGGQAILFPQPWNSATGTWETVLDQLTSLALDGEPPTGGSLSLPS